MNVRMIFGTYIDGKEWRAGERYDATAAQASSLIASGRAEPAVRAEASAPVDYPPAIGAEPAHEMNAGVPIPRRKRKSR